MNSPQQVKNLETCMDIVKITFTQHATDMEHLKQILQKNCTSKELDIYKRAQYYNATIDTDHEGKSADLVVQFIDDFIQNWYNTSNTNAS